MTTIKYTSKIFTQALLFALILVAFGSAVVAQKVSSKQPRLWQVADKSALPARAMPIGENVPVYRLDRTLLKQILDRVPKEFSGAAREIETILEVPTPDGKSMRFRIEESPMLAPEVAAQFPTWKQFVGQGIEDPTATASFDVNELGFHGYVLSAQGTFLIDPYSLTDKTNYVVYYKGAVNADRNPFACQIGGETTAPQFSILSAPTAFSNGTTLRTYRSAWSLTKEYTAFFGNDKTAAFAALQTTVSRMNTIFRRELATTFTIVSDLRTVFDATNDGGFPSANDPDVAGKSNLRNGTVLDTTYGQMAYDIGHVLSVTANPNGLATSPGLCDNDPYPTPPTTGGTTSKAQGFTGAPTPQGDGFDVDYVAHEIGHQFSMSHTFNNDVDGSCGTRAPDSAFEPASGITIMGYGGICAPRNLAANSIEYFNLRSFDQSVNYLQNTTPTLPQPCGTNTATNNIPPTAAVAQASYTIPALTPFTLTATATDPDGDQLTYLWEEFDANINGGTGSIPLVYPVPSPTPTPAPANPPRNNTATDDDADGIVRPIFRAYNPTTGGSRTFPSLYYILNPAGNDSPGSNQPTLTYTGTLPFAPTGGSANGYVCKPTETCVRGERLPTINRTMNFRVTVRDNRAGGGGVTDAGTTVTVAAGAGPFRVTAQDTATNWTGGSTRTVTWDVANTNAAPVNAANVNILLSTDGGQTFPTMLLANTPNDGTETITVPNTPTTTARIKIQPTNNIFFDINNANFTITAGVTITVNPATLPNGTVGTNYNQIITASGGTTPYTFATTAGSLPTGLTLTNGGVLSGTPTATGTFNFTITATDANGSSGSQAYTVTIAAAPQPQPFVVDTTNNDVTLNACTTAPNDCSLRATIAAANSAATNDTITFAIPATDPGCISSVCTITTAGGNELLIASAATAGTLTITNVGGANNVVISGNTTTRVFGVPTGANLTLNSLTVTRGNGVGSGIGGNGFGGGIASAGTLTVNNCTISNNAASNGNSGGGIGIADGTSAVTTINNSTITGNTTTLLGGGIRTGTGTMTVTNSTITNNTSSGANGGGIRNSGGAITLTNTIVAGNTNAASPDVSSTTAVTASYNFIGTNGGNTITNGTNGNQVGTNASPLNPLLAPLASNGGKTQTHALQTGSPAIDKGRTQGTPGIAETLSNASVRTAAIVLAPTATTDQRGFTRPYDDPAIPNASGCDGADIGAFEAQSPTAAGILISGRVLTDGGRGLVNATVYLTDASGATRTTRTTTFGYYRFDEVAAGQTYVLSVKHKQYTFNTRIVSVSEDLTGLDFVAQN